VSLHPDDTIVALASAAGAACRAIVRVSGPQAWPIATAYCTDLTAPSGPLTATPPRQAVRLTGYLRLPAVHAPLPLALHFHPRPRSYTGQDLAELHTIACPPLVDALLAALLGAGARAAQPGEFTLRAFLAGKLDLTQAEAVLSTIEASDRDELTVALARLAGGIREPLLKLRDDLLNLLADIEAGLDFVEEDITFIDPTDTLHRLAAALAHLTNLQRQLAQRADDRTVFRVALVGPPNAGKSSLFNALLAGHSPVQALVSPIAGTTRDYVTGQLHDARSGVTVELIDTAGIESAPDEIGSQAQAHSRREAEQVDLQLVCIPAGEATAASLAQHPGSASSATGLTAPSRWLVATKCDQAPPAPGSIPVSAWTGQGIDQLYQRLLATARTRRQRATTSSSARCSQHVTQCVKHLRNVHQGVLFGEPPELTAGELRLALDELGALVGTIHTEDLLGRIFSRFCIGK
jgi:tRNA modification GTPase